MALFYDLENFYHFQLPSGEQFYLSPHRMGPNGTYMIAVNAQDAKESKNLYTVLTVQLNAKDSVRECSQFRTVGYKRKSESEKVLTAGQAATDINHRCLKSAQTDVQEFNKMIHDLQLKNDWTLLAEAEPIRFIRLDYPMHQSKWQRLGVPYSQENLEKLQRIVTKNPFLWIEFMSGSHDNEILADLVNSDED